VHVLQHDQERSGVGQLAEQRRDRLEQLQPAVVRRRLQAARQQRSAQISRFTGRLDRRLARIGEGSTGGRSVACGSALPRSPSSAGAPSDDPDRPVSSPVSTGWSASPGARPGSVATGRSRSTHGR